MQGRSNGSDLPPHFFKSHDSKRLNAKHMFELKIYRIIMSCERFLFLLDSLCLDNKEIGVDPFAPIHDIWDELIHTNHYILHLHL